MAKHSYIVVAQDVNNIPQETVILYHLSTDATNGFNTADVITAYATNDFDPVDDQAGYSSSMPSFQFVGSYSRFSCLEYRESGVSGGLSLSALFTNANSIKNSTTDLNTQIVSGGLYATGLDQYSTNVSINTALGSANAVFASEIYVEQSNDPYYIVYSDFGNTYGTYWNASIDIPDEVDNTFNASFGAVGGDIFGDLAGVTDGTHVRTTKKGLLKLAALVQTDATSHLAWAKLVSLLLSEIVDRGLYKNIVDVSKIKKDVTSDELTILKNNLYL